MQCGEMRASARLSVMTLLSIMLSIARIVTPASANTGERVVTIGAS